MKRTAVVLALGLIGSAACSPAVPSRSDRSPTMPTAGTSVPAPSSPATETVAPTIGATVTPTSPPAAGSMSISIAVAGTVVAAALDDNPTAGELLASLPLTLTMRDYNRVEKTAALPTPLTTEGVPRGADPELFDIGYYAPDQVLVLYYGEVGFFDGIVRLGRFDPAAAALIQDQPDDTTITVTSA